MLKQQSMNAGIFNFIVLGLLGLTIVGVLRFIHFYNLYQRHLREFPPREYQRLILKDELVGSVGQWIRWPVGSAGPILSIFNLKQSYGDNDLFRIQKKALFWFVIFLASFVLSLLVMIGPKTS